MFNILLIRHIYIQTFPINSKRCKAESSEACCQWALLNVHIITTLFTFSVHLSSCPKSACWVFSCFRNPRNSDINYRIFNVRVWSFLCVRIHTGVGHTDSESAQQCWLRKTHQLFRVRRSINWASRSPQPEMTLCGWRGYQPSMNQFVFFCIYMSSLVLCRCRCCAFVVAAVYYLTPCHHFYHYSCSYQSSQNLESE